MSGPYAVVLRYRLDGQAPPPDELHAAFLGIVRRADPALARLLHAGAMGRRPFTLVPLGLPGRSDAVGLRLAVLDPQVFARFWDRWERRGPPPLVVNGRALPLDLVATSGPWAGEARWADLGAGGTGRSVGLSFCTPTTFRQGDLDLPLPVPRLVFGGLLEKWNAFAPFPIEVDMAAIERGVALAGARVRTRAFPDGRARIPGFVGWGEFRVGRRESPDLVRALHVLADFAFFAGVGRKTTHGMGLTKRQA